MFPVLRSRSCPGVRRLARRSLLAAPIPVALALGLALGGWAGAGAARPVPPSRPDSPSATEPSAPTAASAQDTTSTGASTPHPRSAQGERARLEAAVREAHENCLVATLVEQGLGPARRPLFATAALQQALDTDLVNRQAYGELPALRQEARWLGGLAPDSDLGPRSWEDVRFLLGFVHWYLDGALGARQAREAHALQPDDYDWAALRIYRGLDFTDLLGLWD